jgi:signal transduction histidine kinase
VKTSLATVVAGSLAAGLVLALTYGGHGVVVTALLLAGLGGAALALAHLAARRRGRLGSLKRQFTLAVAIAVGQLIVALVVVGELMFVSHHDALLVSVMAVFVGLIAARAAQLLAGGVLHDVEAVRDGLRAVGEGERHPSIDTEGRDELAELGDAARAMGVRLEAEESARRHLVAAVSHDLRTPLTSLRLLAEAVDDDIVDNGTRRRYLADMQTHIRALSALIDDLFELSRLEAGDIEWGMERVSVASLIGETVDAMRAEAAARHVEVVAVCGSGAPDARANPEKLQRVLFNLIQNAIRHTPADGSVTVRAEPDGPGVTVEVADTGDGIAEGERERVFEAFYRGGSEAARTRSGAGLGLAISRAIVEAHGGRMWLEDGEPGTRVRFTVPAAP